MEVYLSCPCIPLWYGLGQLVITFCKLCLVTGLKAGYFDDIWCFGLELCGFWLELVVEFFETFGSMMGSVSLSIRTNFNISGRRASWHCLLVLSVGIAACTDTFLELNCHYLSVCIKLGWSNKIWFMFISLFGFCLSVCLSQIYIVWWLIIISVATYPVLRAVHPAITSVPVLASIQGVPESVDSHAYIAR